MTVYIPSHLLVAGSIVLAGIVIGIIVRKKTGDWDIALMFPIIGTIVGGSVLGAYSITEKSKQHQMAVQAVAREQHESLPEEWQHLSTALAQNRSIHPRKVLVAQFLREDLPKMNIEQFDNFFELINCYEGTTSCFQWKSDLSTYLARFVEKVDFDNFAKNKE